MTTELPFTNYVMHEKTSGLVSKLNHHLGKENISDFIGFCEGLAKKGLYLFMEVRISFPPGACQEDLKHLPPVMRKAQVPLSWLSRSQKKLAKGLGLNISDRTKINVSDFTPQVQILSFEYISMLIHLNIRIDEVLSCCTANKGRIFQTCIENLIEMKTKSTSSFFKQWFKLIANSSYGYLAIKVNRQTDRQTDRQTEKF